MVQAKGALQLSPAWDALASRDAYLLFSGGRFRVGSKTSGEVLDRTPGNRTKNCLAYRLEVATRVSVSDCCGTLAWNTGSSPLRAL